MTGRSNRRRRHMVEGFQAQFVLVILAWFAVFCLLFAAGLFLPLIRVLLRDGPSAETEVAGQFLRLHRTLWPILLVFFAAVVVVLVRTSHRVAGPLYRFRQVFQQVTQGSLAIRVRLRENDYLTDEAEALDQMLAVLRSRVGEAQRGLDEAKATVEDWAARGELPAEEVRRLEATLTRARRDLAFTTEFAPTGSAGASSTEGNERSAAGPAVGREAGFSLMELVIALSILATLAAIGIPAYKNALDSARVARAIGDIRAIDREIRAWRISKSCYPGSLGDIGFGDIRDPWGGQYVYGVLGKPAGKGGKPGGTCNACTGGCLGTGSARKDGRLVPINSDYDLFSLGADRRTASALTAAPSQDDIVRANDGGFIGRAADY